MNVSPLLDQFENGDNPIWIYTTLTESGARNLVRTMQKIGWRVIELPIEMVLDPELSMAMRTDSFQGGIHVYSGRVQIGSLRDYLIAAMRNHKWKLVGEASYKNSMLAFTKPNRTCMVILSEDSAGILGKTQANLYVTVDVAAAGRLNPFGEPIAQ